jgi:predicted esterase YcpF (UPF0227 family)
MPLTHLLYLHGFRSSPTSAKARRMAAWAAEQPGLTFACPQLPPSPREAMALAAGLVAAWPATGAAVIGSSLEASMRPRWPSSASTAAGASPS